MTQEELRDSPILWPPHGPRAWDIYPAGTEQLGRGEDEIRVLAGFPCDSQASPG